VPFIAGVRQGHDSPYQVRMLVEGNFWGILHLSTSSVLAYSLAYIGVVVVHMRDTHTLGIVRRCISLEQEIYSPRILASSELNCTYDTLLSVLIVQQSRVRPNSTAMHIYARGMKYEISSKYARVRT
jgi:hypothetical protein